MFAAKNNKELLALQSDTFMAGRPMINVCVMQRRYLLACFFYPWDKPVICQQPLFECFIHCCCSAQPNAVDAQ